MDKISLDHTLLTLLTLRAVVPVDLQHCHESCLWYLHLAQLLHPLFTLCLFLQQLLFAADVAAVTLCQDVLPVWRNGLTGNHLGANTCLDSNDSSIKSSINQESCVDRHENIHQLKGHLLRKQPPRYIWQHFPSPKQVRTHRQQDTHECLWQSQIQVH